MSQNILRYVMNCSLCSQFCMCWALMLQQGQTALHFACEGNNVDAVECLISLKADVGIPDKVCLLE